MARFKEGDVIQFKKSSVFRWIRKVRETGYSYALTPTSTFEMRTEETVDPLLEDGWHVWDAFVYKGPGPIKI